MTIKELKQLLKDLPDDAEVIVRNHNGNFFPCNTVARMFKRTDPGTVVEMITLEARTV